MSNSSIHLFLKVAPEGVKAFSQLLQRGFRVKAQVGCSLKELFCHQWGLNPEYVETRISTVFLNGKPVDDLNAATVNEGSVLAISAAMPGLVGATLRRGGYYASLRSQISHTEEPKPATVRDGVIVIKLFNVIAAELGTLFLRRGVLVRRQDLIEFFASLPEEFWAGCISASVNGQELNLTSLREMGWFDESQMIRLRVEVGEWVSG